MYGTVLHLEWAILSPHLCFILPRGLMLYDYARPPHFELTSTALAIRVVQARTGHARFEALEESRMYGRLPTNQHGSTSTRTKPVDKPD